MQAGSIAGGAFLKEFVKDDIPWCHFDIAGTAWADTETTSQGKVKEKPYTPSGATGNVIRLVLDLIGSYPTVGYAQSPNSRRCAG